MEPYTIIIYIAVAITISAFVIVKSRKEVASENDGDRRLVPSSTKALWSEGTNDMTVRFEEFTALTEQEESRLVEVKDSTLLVSI